MIVVLGVAVVLGLIVAALIVEEGLTKVANAIRGSRPYD